MYSKGKSWLKINQAKKLDALLQWRVCKGGSNAVLDAFSLDLVNYFSFF